MVGAAFLIAVAEAVLEATRPAIEHKGHSSRRERLALQTAAHALRRQSRQPIVRFRRLVQMVTELVEDPARVSQSSATPTRRAGVMLHHRDGLRYLFMTEDHLDGDVDCLIVDAVLLDIQVLEAVLQSGRKRASSGERWCKPDDVAGVVRGHAAAADRKRQRVRVDTLCVYDGRGQLGRKTH
jgi:hypothetical protein